MKLMKRLFPKMLALAALLFIINQTARSQAGGPLVNVSIVVTPPYSTNAKDYVQQGNNVLITLTNLGSTPQQLIIIPSISGSNGVKAALRSNYMPPVGFQLGANQTRTITLNQLKAVNSTVTPADINVQKMTAQDYANNVPLPEGVYTVCVNVKNFVPGRVIDEQACGTFSVNSYDAPIILNPVSNATVKPLNPQFVNFNWTPTGIAGKTKYTLKLINLTATPVNNPIDAFENKNILPFYQQTNILTNNLVLDNSKPKLKEGDKYALQVVAYDPLNKLLFKNQGRSQVIVFTYKDELGLANNPGNAVGLDDPPKGPCVSPTKWNGALKQVNKNGLPNGSAVAVGHFVMKNTSFTQSNGSYSGTGEILVHFINTKVKVEFTNIKIGDDNRMFEGKITAKVVSNTVINDAMAKDKTGSLETVPNMDQLMNYLESNNRDASKLNPANSIDMPVHIDKNGFRIGIVGMIFEPTETYINAVMNTPLPQAVSDDYLLLSVKGLGVHPNGYGLNEVKLSLAKDVSLALSDKLSLSFNGGVNETFAKFDCNGFKSLSLSGAVVLNRSIALPLNNQLDVINDNNTKVKAPFELKDVTSINNFLLDNLNFSHKFSIADANDFAIECKGLSLDLSTTENGASFKTAYPDKANKKDWIGVYVKDITVYLPGGFKKTGGGHMSVSAKNAYVDKMGFSGNLSASGQIFSEGTLAGWGIKLNKIDLKISQSKLAGGGIGGLLSLPLGEKTELGFFAKISKGDANGADVQLVVETKDEIDADLFLAKIKLFEGSTVDIGKENGKYYAKAELNGEISVKINSKKTNSNVSKFDLPNIKFQELTIDGKDEANYVPNFDVKFASLQNQQGLQAKIGGFELNLNELAFKKSGDKKSAGLSFGLGISLFGGGNNQQNGVGAKTGFTIWAKHDGARFKYDKASLDSISVDAELGVAKIKGSVNIYDEDATYGNGFRGKLAASLAGLGVGIDVTFQIGRTLENKGNFKYWYFDAMIDFGKLGLNIPGTAASLYGFGGGAWCNMDRTGGSDVIKPANYKPVAKGGDAAPTTSGATMVPSKGLAGFRAAVLFGITGSREAFNGDLTFEMQLNANTLSVNHIKLEGNAYLMQNPDNPARRDPDKAFVHCFAKIEYDVPTRVLSGNFGAEVNVLGLIEGGGEISFKFDMPDRDKNGNVKPGQHLKWYLKVGQWTPGVDPFDDNKRLHADIGFDAKVLKVSIELQGYFMVGNDLPSGLPPLPDKIYQMTKSMGAPLKKELPSSVSNTQGLAFAFGAGIKLEFDFDIKIVHVYLEAAAGFDVLISDLNATCEGAEMGFNGWYAQGQAYAYIHGGISALGDAITIAEFMAGAVLQIKLPNPTWVRGDVYFYINVLGIDGHFSRTIEKGHICDNMKIDLDPFASTKLIKNISPINKTKGVNPLDAEAQVDFAYADMVPIKIYNTYLEYNEVYFMQAQMKLLDKNKKEINGYDYDIVPANKGKSFRLLLKKTLEPNTDYYIWAKAEIYGEKTEEVTVKFTTGDRPAQFGMKDVVESYPLPNQRFFMKQEPDGTLMRGFIKLKQDLAYLFEKGDVYVLFFTGNQQLAAFAKASSGTNQEYNATSSATVYFDIPKEIKNSTVYEIKIYGPDPDAQKNNNVFGKVVFEGFHFRTSRYNNFQDKLNSFKIAKVGYIRHTINVPFIDAQTVKDKTTANVFYVPVLLMQGGEELDGYEMFGYYKTVNDEKDLYGKLFYGYSTESSHYLNHSMMKYKYLKTQNGTRTPEINESDFNYFYKYAERAENAIVNKRPQGFPWEGIQPFGDPFTSGYNMFFMKGIQNYESILKSGGYLKGNEKITGPEGPLTADDINGGGGNGFINNNLGLGNGGQTPTKYYAMMDYSPLVAAWVHMKWVLSMFNEVKKDKADIWRAYKVTEQLGMPRMPVGEKHTVVFGADAGIGTGHKNGEVKLNYTYNPPK